MRNGFSVIRGPATVMLEDVELNFIEPWTGCAYMYVYRCGIRTVPSFSLEKNN